MRGKRESLSSNVPVSDPAQAAQGTLELLERLVLSSGRALWLSSMWEMNQSWVGTTQVLRET